MARLLPKYKCAAIARYVTQQAHVSPGIEWTDVRNFYQPPLSGVELGWLDRYDSHERESILQHLDREGRYLHVWTP